MKMSWKLSAPAATEEERDLLRREYRLSQASSEFWLGFDSLNARIHAATDLLRSLRGVVESLSPSSARLPLPLHETAPAEKAPVAPALPQLQAAPAATPAAEAAMPWMLAAAAVLGGLTFFLFRRYRARQPAYLQQDAFFEANERIAEMPAPPTQEPEPPSATQASGADDGLRRNTVPAPEPELSRPAFNPDREEMDHALDLAEVMLSYGRKSGAMQTLKDYLREHPTVSVRPWLRLLELHRQTGMREDFELAAEMVHRHFNVKVPGWDEGVSGVPLQSFFEEDEGVEILGLEQVPHIMARIQATWPFAECQQYLQNLLLDNRGGGRQGFPVSVVAEILLLEDILNDRLAGQA